jgi:hypothetical protein
MPEVIGLLQQKHEKYGKYIKNRIRLFITFQQRANIVTESFKSSVNLSCEKVACGICEFQQH